MANLSLETEICRVCYLILTFVGNLYKNFKFYVMPNLICDAIIGDDLLQQHKSLTFKFQGKLSELVVSTIMSVANVPYPQLFDNSLSARCKPIEIKTRKFSSHDMAITKAETVRLCKKAGSSQIIPLGGHNLLWLTMVRRSKCALTTAKPSIYSRI